MPQPSAYHLRFHDDGPTKCQHRTPCCGLAPKRQLCRGRRANTLQAQRLVV